MLNMRNCLTLPRWNEILIEIYKTQDRNNYCQKLNRKIRGSLTHLRDMVRLLAKHNFIEINSGNKIKRLILTEKGKIITSALLVIKAELS